MPGESEWLAWEIAEIRRRLIQQESKPVRIPFLDADPPVGDAANIWGFEDKRLRVRMPGGAIAEYRPFDQPYIPTLSTDPAASTGIQMWLRGDTGEMRARLANGTVQRYSPVTTTTSTASSAPPPTSAAPKPVPYVPKTRVFAWTADWAASYRQNGSKRTDNNHLYYGRVESFNGLQRSLAGFPGGIQTTLAAARSIKKVELYIQNLHTWSNAGGDISIWGHGYASEPASSPGVGTLIGTYRFPKVGVRSPSTGGWFTVPVIVGARFASGYYKGITLYNSSTSVGRYGYARGISDGGTPPRIRVTYVK